MTDFTTVASAPPTAPHVSLASTEHLVQFYEEEAFLHDVVSDFLGAGLRLNEPVVVIATQEHRDAFAANLATKGFDLAAHHVQFLDARETLSTFMRDSFPDQDMFRANVGGVLAEMLRTTGHSRVRAYGEMVDLLWRDSKPEAAIRLEELWNELAHEYMFSLLCAYPMGNFYKETHRGLFEHVCRTHTQVAPAESFAALASTMERDFETARLQQRAAALENEVQHRKELENALREALASRRATEEALRRSERELRDFVENATIGLHWVAPDGTILWANAAELELLGYSAGEFIGRNIAEFHADKETIDDILERLSAGESIRDYEARLCARDGSIRHVAISSNALFEDGKFMHTRCFTRDITDRKRLEAERAFLLDAATVLNRSLDYEVRLREVTQLVVPEFADWCAVDMLRDDGAYDRLSVTHVHPERAALALDLARTTTSAAENDPVTQVLQTGEPQVVEHATDEILKAVARDENHLQQMRDLGLRSWMVVPMAIPGRVLGAITFAAAGSDRRYTSEDLPFATELARRAAIAVQNAKLYKLAQNANRMKDEFLATLSHELRTPLTAILGWARLLTLGGLDPETTRVAFETIERSARTQATLIDDLLDLSRVVTGKLKMQTELVDLSSVITETVQTMRLAAEAKNILLKVEGTSERAVVIGDPTRLQQITLNLLSNAVKFSDNGSEVSMSLERAGEKARIVVRDNGRGISRQFLPYVFEPFRQADAASTRAHGGLGLGLAIVKYLTEHHGGTVTASSDGEGHGSTFTVTLPLATRRSAPDDVDAAAERVDLAGTSVLVVDDDADTRELVTAMLRRWGADVDSAPSVGEATRSLRLKLPDVVVTDIAMPAENGYDLLNFVQSQESMRHVPIVALTASGRPGTEASLRQAGFHAFARKPIDPLGFAQMIANLAPAHK